MDIKFYHDFSAGEYDKEQAEKLIKQELWEINPHQRAQKIDVDVCYSDDVTVFYEATALMPDGQSTKWSSGYYTLQEEPPTDRENLFYVSRGNSIGEYSDWFPPTDNIDAARKLVQDLDGDATIWRYKWFDDSETYEPIIIE